MSETSWIQIDDDDDDPVEVINDSSLPIPPKQKKIPTLYHQCSRLVGKTSRRVTRDAIDGSSKVVQDTFLKCLDKETISGALVKLPKLINDVSHRNWVPSKFLETSFPLLGIDYKVNEKEKKCNGENILSLMEEFESTRITPEATKFADTWHSLQTYIQKTAEFEACSITPVIPKSGRGLSLKLRKPVKSTSSSSQLTKFMMKQSSTSAHFADMNAFYIAAMVNAYQEKDVISVPPPHMIINDKIQELNSAKDILEPIVKKEKKEKLPKIKKGRYPGKTKKCLRRRQPRKRFDPYGSSNPVCLEHECLRGEKTTPADLISLKLRKLKPETARIKPANPLTTAFCDAPWFRKQLKTGNFSKPIPLVEEKNRIGCGKRSLLERKLNAKAALCVHQPIPMPVSLPLFAPATPWTDEFPDNYDEYYEEYKQYVVNSHDNYRSKEENNWKDYHTEIKQNFNNPFNDYEVIQQLNLGKTAINTFSQELKEHSIERDKRLASLLQNASIKSQ
uniref:Uncharacterized protein n=1 Tax=Panagrolaimus superbus TaxID=310955 RepID=A0A914Z1S5_9BILA